jgi:hypothetical protein
MGSTPPLAALHVDTTGPSPLAQYAQLQQIRNAQTQQQTQQLQQTGLAQENQQRALQLQDQQTLRALAPNHVIKDSDGNVTGFDMPGLIQEAAGKQVNPNTLNQMGNAYAESVKNMAAATEATRNNELAKNKAAYELVEGARGEPDVTKRAAIIQAGLPNLQKLGVDTSHLAQLIANPDDKSVDSFEAGIGMHAQALADAKTAAETNQANQKANLDKMEAAEKGSPLTKMENDPTMFAGDKLAAAKAYLQSKMADASNPADQNRATRLMAIAKNSETATVALKQREQQAQQAVSQGDPDAAGKLLANRSLTIEELKSRSVTPQFVTSAIQNAQKYDPTYKAAEASGQAAIAKAPANQMFFGNTDSLLIKGGTLDQLSEAGKNLGNLQLPTWNSVANLVSAKLGKGPVAAYAAAVLNVADDQAKVMGGTGASTDTSRQQSFDLFGKNMSNEAREASINQVRQGVLSQRRGRIGSNPYLKDMYPEPEGTARGGGTLEDLLRKYPPAKTATP